MDPIQSLLSHLRARDHEELHEYGMNLNAADAAMRAYHVDFCMWSTDEGGPAAALWFDQLTPRAVAASLLATDEWPKVATSVIKYGLRHVKPKLLRMGYTRAECRTMAHHEDAIRLLNRMGFVCEVKLRGYGAKGADFYQYAWNIMDHQNADG